MIDKNFSIGGTNQDISINGQTVPINTTNSPYTGPALATELTNLLNGTGNYTNVLSPGATVTYNPPTSAATPYTFSFNNAGNVDTAHNTISFTWAGGATQTVTLTPDLMTGAGLATTLTNALLGRRG